MVEFSKPIVSGSLSEQIMNLDDLKFGFRRLIRDPLNSALLIFGMGTAIAALVLVLALFRALTVPDPTVPDPDSVVRLEYKLNIPGRQDPWFSGAPFSFRDELITAKAPIVGATRVLSGSWAVRVEDKVVTVDGAFVDADVVNVFGLTARQGDLKAALNRPDGIAFSIDAATRLFGTAQAIGRQVLVNGQTLTCVATFDTPSSNSELKVGALVRFESQANAFPREMMSAHVAGKVFVRLNPGATANGLTQIAQSIFDQSPDRARNPAAWIENGRKAAFLRAIPLSKLGLHGADGQKNQMQLVGLGIAAVTMLVLSAINYVNLTIVRTLVRQREIGIRKSLGDDARQLAIMFMTESLLVASCAGLTGIGLACALSQSFQALMELPMPEGVITLGSVGWIGALCILLGLLTSIYPARIAIGVRSARLMTGRTQSETQSGRWLRRGSTAFQLAGAISVSMVALVVLLQERFSTQLDPGFRTENILTVDLPQHATSSEAALFRQALAGENGISGASLSSGVPGRNDVGQIARLRNKGPEQPVRGTRVDAHFFVVYGIHFLAGELADGTDSENDKPIVLDLTAVRALGFSSAHEAVGRTVVGALRSGDVSYRIVAVTGPIRQESTHVEPVAHMYMLTDSITDSLSVSGSDLVAARRAVERIWPRYFPDDVPDIVSLKDYIARHYRIDRQVGTLVAATSVLALFLASLGIYALAAHSVKIRTMEITIRKLYGASSSNIAGFFAREFVLLLCVGAAAGVPIGLALCEIYLSAFFLRAPIGAIPSIVSVTAAAILTAIAAARHVVAATRKRPAKALIAATG